MGNNGKESVSKPQKEAHKKLAFRFSMLEEKRIRELMVEMDNLIVKMA